MEDYLVYPTEATIEFGTVESLGVVETWRSGGNLYWATALRPYGRSDDISWWGYENTPWEAVMKAIWQVLKLETYCRCCRQTVYLGR